MKKFLLTVGLFFLVFHSMGFAQDTFVVGVPPITDPAKLEKSFQPFTDYISKSLGLPAKLIVSKSYEAFADAFVAGEISLGFFGAVLYVQTKDKHPDKVHYLATCLQNKGGRTRGHYYGYFLVNANSPYKSLKYLKGKKWGFTKKSSSSGYRYPMAYFSRKKIDPYTYFGEVKFLEKHPRITDALAAWKPGADNIIDGGATWDVNLWEAEEKHGKVFRKIARVGPIPLIAIAVSETVAQNKAIRDKIVRALTQDVPEEVTETEDFLFSGWKVGFDSDFDITRRIVGIEK
ncbi:PhnD/SsuA/transferrin family substrate-binding protein [Desulfobacterales bacterium HSG2]|nr:PhnD/SsuA/transferrin family substrate-binding protein [Desulfobacterales bacterium HSG2]